MRTRHRCEMKSRQISRPLCPARGVPSGRVGHASDLCALQSTRLHPSLRLEHLRVLRDNSLTPLRAAVALRGHQRWPCSRHAGLFLGVFHFTIVMGFLSSYPFSFRRISSILPVLFEDLHVLVLVFLHLKGMPPNLSEHFDVILDTVIRHIHRSRKH